MARGDENETNWYFAIGGRFGGWLGFLVGSLVWGYAIDTWGFWGGVLGLVPAFLAMLAAGTVAVYAWPFILLAFAWFLYQLWMTGQQSMTAPPRKAAAVEVEWVCPDCPPGRSKAESRDPGATDAQRAAPGSRVSDA